MTEKKIKKVRNKKKLLGRIVSDKMDKTVVVLVERLVKHPLYKKYIKRRTRLLAHNNFEECKIGDKVLIIESSPISKKKNFRVSKIIEKAKIL